MRKILISTLLICWGFSVNGQCIPSPEKRNWTNGFSKSVTCSTFKNFAATGNTEDEARKKAIDQYVEWQSGATGRRAQVQVSNGNIVISGSDELTVKTRIIDEYIENFGSVCKVHILVQIANNPSCRMEDYEFTDKYDFSPRVFVPGMAQIHKGSAVKGILFITGETVLIGGIVVTESLRASNEAKISSTRDKQTYIDNANMYKNARWGFTVGAIALYLYNAIDGWVAKGDKHLKVLGDTDLHVMPYFVPNVGSGVMLSFNF